MANDTQSSRKIRGDDSTSSRNRFINGKGSSSGSGTTNSSGLRRSARETSSRKQVITSPSRTRKSERLEKRMPMTPPVKKKSGRIDQQMIPSPLRRSDRAKKHSSSSSSGSKKSETRSGSADMKHKKEKEDKRVKQLTTGAQDVRGGEKHDLNIVTRKRKVVDGRTFKARFKRQRIRDTAPAVDEELERPGKLSQSDSSDAGSSGSKQVEDRENWVDECSGRVREELSEECAEKASEGASEKSNSCLRNFDAETSSNHIEVELLDTSQKHSCTDGPYKPSDGHGIKASKSCNIIKENLDDAKTVMVDCTVMGKLHTLELIGSTAVGRSLDHETDLGNDDKAMPSRRKMYKMHNASAMVASKDILTSNAEAVSSSSFACKRLDFTETCVTCCKRLYHDSSELELCNCNTTSKDLCDTTIPEDRGELEANVTRGFTEKFDCSTLDKEAPLDIQMDGHENVCVICTLGGKLLRCDGKGCKRCYHFSCLDPPLDDVPPGVLHCFWCVKKKIESGVHSVSEGVESIWDDREVEKSDAEGLRRQKQYFVKYKGLSHTHNHWVPETQLLVEAPSLLMKFNQKNQAMSWNAEWTLPHRLLKKRLLMPPKQENNCHGGYADDISGCQFEWLVKWRGLGYEHATWELDNVSFLCSSEGQNLIREYENRQERAKRAAFSVDKSKKELPLKLSKLQAGSSHGIDNNHLNSVNKLRECWHKGQNVLLLDDQERVTKVVLFILSFAHVCEPFLIITTSSALSTWEAEFMRLAPSIDVIVYSGNRDSRRSIRTVEFYDGGCTMFQVLLSPSEAVVEDLEVLESVRWEAIIIDECQCPRISTHFEKLKILATGVRVLLFSDQIKDSIDEYLNLLLLLDSRGGLGYSDGPTRESDNNLGKLKERLSRFIANDCKSNFSRFVEYWIPVQISNVQLEQYCATLLSNSLSLCSCSKNDPFEALREVLISTRKCCDHPYIVDPYVQGSITEGLPVVEYLDVEIKASGKLQLLDMILPEIKKRQLRVLLLFQSIGGSGRVPIGDILDDFLRYRFGPDSYERVDGVGVIPSKKQAALNKFNDKESGRFVFLLDTRACLPSIKLSSVDTIVIFDSDWNPANDLRLLHKISIESQFEQIKIFRLYSSCTVEEKVLILAKNNTTLDSNLQCISRSTSDALLMWGASYLFKKLDEFHSDKNPASGSNIFSDQLFLSDVVKEFLALLVQSGKNNEMTNSTILKAQQIGGSYSTNLPLPGELKMQSTDGEQPHAFWTNLLKGRNPRWKYSSIPTQRNRKRVQYFDKVPKKHETGDIGKKRKKVVTNCVDPTSLKHVLEEGHYCIPADNQSLPGSTACIGNTLPTNHASKPLISSDNSLSPGFHMNESEERIQSDVQKSLHLLLEPDISEICKILKLSEDVKVMVGKFLEYIIMNHHVNREPATILQAFQISLCWVAASLLKAKIDKKESLALAKLHLNFSCKEEEANYVYSKLRELKKMFLSHLENVKELGALKDSISVAEGITKIPSDARVSHSREINLQNVKVEVEDGSQNQEFADKQKVEAPTNRMVEDDMPKSVRRIQKKCEKRMAKLLREQEEEIQEFHRIWEGKRLQLENEHECESALVRSLHRQIAVRKDKLKTVDKMFSKKMEEHKCQKDMCLKDLKAKQSAARNEEKQKATNWLAEAKSCSIEDIFSDKLPLNGSECGSKVGYCQASEDGAHSGPEDVVAVSDRVMEEQNPDGIVRRMQMSGVVQADNRETLPNDSVGCSVPAGIKSIRADKTSENDEVVTMPLQSVSTGRIEQPSGVGSCFERLEEIVCINPPFSGVQIPDGALSSVRGEEIQSEVPEAVPCDEVIGDAGLVEMGISAVEPDAENANSSVNPNAVGNQIDGADSSINGDSTSTEPSLTKLPSTHPVVSPARDDPMPQNLDQCSQSFICTEMRDEEAPDRGNRNSLNGVEVPSLQSVDSGPTDQLNHEQSLFQPLEQLQPSFSTDLPVDHDQPDFPAANGIAHEREAHTSSQNAEALRLLPEDAAEVSHQAVQQIGANLESHSPLDATESPLGHNQPDVHSNTGVIHQSSELHPSFQVAGTLLPNQSVSQPGVNLFTIQGSNNLPTQTLHQVPFQMQTRPLYTDPLQIELERIRKEVEQAIKVHEDMKLRLKSDCEKEIEEIIAEIRSKYTTKLQVAEAAFLLKKNELDMNQNKVLMNKILAEAFRSKCLNLRSSGASGMKQVSGSLQQVHQLSLQPTPRSVPSLFSAGQPATGQQISLPHPQVVPHSAPLLSTTMPRPPHISPITPSMGNLRVSSEIRAPAPHIQPFRPSAGMAPVNLTSMPRGIANLQAPSNMPPACPSLPQPPSQPQSLSSPVRPQPLPANHSGPCGNPAQPESVGTLPASLNLSLSVHELLTDIDNQHSTRQPNILPPLRDFGSNFDSLDLSEFGIPGSLPGSSVPFAAVTDIVCLSDDD